MAVDDHRHGHRHRHVHYNFFDDCSYTKFFPKILNHALTWNANILSFITRAAYGGSES